MNYLLLISAEHNVRMKFEKPNDKCLCSMIDLYVNSHGSLKKIFLLDTFCKDNKKNTNFEENSDNETIIK